jgi:DNA polymerase-3 subunit epsilon
MKRAAGRRLVGLVGGALSLAAAAIVASLLAIAQTSGSGTPELGLAAAAAVGIVFTLLAWFLLTRFARPLDRLALDLVIIARDNPELALRIGKSHRLSDLVAGIDLLRRRVQEADAKSAAALARATLGLEEQTRRLEAILLDLDEGVIVCNLQHQILLYNRAAADLIDVPQGLGLGRPLFPTLTQEPVVHALERKLRDVPRQLLPRSGERFVCGSAEGRMLLQARLGLIRDAEGNATGYILTLSEIGQLLSAATARDELLHHATEGLRRPLANFRAAAETLADNPALAEVERRAFEEVLLTESRTLSDRLDDVAQAYRALGGGRWLAYEIYSNDLVASLMHRLGKTSSVRLTAVGLPQWLYGDSLSLLVLLAHLVEQIHRHNGATELDIAFSPGDHRLYIELVWMGRPIAAATIDQWLDQPLLGGIGPLTGRAVLQRHGSDLWSEAGRGATAMLRLPIAAAAPIHVPARHTPRPQRPEFYDFDLLGQPLPTGRFSDRPLRQLTYVVFDVETTGLHPALGDAVVALAAVRIVNGRILTMENLDRLIDPGRPIPAESVKFHGITDGMVKDKPPLSVVLPEFQRFAKDAVLVAHNAAFDLTFLKRAATSSTEFLENPVLDTLLLSAYLDAQESNHSLDGIASRLGLTIMNRHNALDDSLATATILLNLLDRLEARGLTTLAQVTAALNVVAQLRGRQKQLEGLPHVLGSA